MSIFSINKTLAQHLIPSPVNQLKNGNPPGLDPRLRGYDGSTGLSIIRPKTEAGVALITALLVVAIATSTAIAIASRQYLEIRQTANLLGRDQAYLIALGGEFWAKQVLTEDLKEGKTDSLEEIWASQPASIAVQGGTIQGRIYDQQALFNLNNLIDSNDKQNPLAMARFQRLLEKNHLDPTLAIAVADWIDANKAIGGSGGAEDQTYLPRDPSTFTANQPMFSVSELMLIEGFNSESVEKLTPWVTTLPAATPININTAPIEILHILAPGISLMDAQTLADERRKKEFASVDEFLHHPILKEKNISQDGLSVASDYFQAILHAKVGRGKTHLFSLFGRNGGKVTLLRRRQGVD